MAEPAGCSCGQQRYDTPTGGLVCPHCDNPCTTHRCQQCRQLTATPTT